MTTPSAAQAAPPGNAGVFGVGQVVLTQPDAVGHRVWFGVLASADAAGSSRGRFWFRHLLPDGSVLAQGWAEVTCLQVTGDVALFTAVVPEGVGVVKNHAFAMKVIDGGARPDQVAFIQAGGGPDRPPARCIDFDVEHPGQPYHQVRAGGYAVHGG
ncbi:hypothetical protein [Actinoplanes sp. M2I2]|uniref:hypothetical protein n=1 Tax=Actinoplanes sp. M2I2 TaxID=1734444 RepID=UPI00202174E2|nr:hypothetical protein [Actinoplanes sp. M2I2]